MATEQEETIAEPVPAAVVETVEEDTFAPAETPEEAAEAAAEPAILLPDNYIEDAQAGVTVVEEILRRRHRSRRRCDRRHRSRRRRQRQAHRLARKFPEQPSRHWQPSLKTPASGQRSFL